MVHGFTAIANGMGDFSLTWICPEGEFGTILSYSFGATREAFIITELNHKRFTDGFKDGEAEARIINKWIGFVESDRYTPGVSRNIPGFAQSDRGVSAGALHDFGRFGIPWFIQEGDMITLGARSRSPNIHYFDMSFLIGACSHPDCQENPRLMRACIEKERVR